MKRWLIPNIFAIIILGVMFLIFHNRELPYEGGMVIEAFTLTGFFVIMGAMIIYIDKAGVFNIVIYGFKKVFRMIQRNPSEDFPATYFEFNEKRKAREKITLWPTFTVGAIYITLGFVIYFILN